MSETSSKGDKTTLQDRQIIDHQMPRAIVGLHVQPHHPDLRGSHLLSNTTDNPQQYYAARKVALGVTDTIIVSCIVGTVAVVIGYYLLRRFCFEKRIPSRNLRQHRITAARAEVVRLQGRSCTFSQSADVEQVSVSIEVIDPLREELRSALESQTVAIASVIV